MRLGLGLTICSLALEACGAIHSSSTLTEFRATETVSTEPVVMVLPRAQGIPHDVTRERIAGGKYFFDSWRYQVTFSSISLSEFNALLAQFGGWSTSRSRVHWQPGASYSLSDFLPPLLQATEGTVFKQHETIWNFPATSGERHPAKMFLLSNCWGTAFEILRGAQTQRETFDLFYASHAAARDFFRSQVFTTELRPFSKSSILQSSAAFRNQKLMPGDVLLIGDDWLQHVAIFIDDDLYFEKAGTGTNAMYRLTHAEILLQTWDPTLFGWSWHRRNGTPLPEPSELFSIEKTEPNSPLLAKLSSEERKHLSIESGRRTPGDIPDPTAVTLFGHAIVELLYDARGRAYLPHELFTQQGIDARMQPREEKEETKLN